MRQKKLCVDNASLKDDVTEESRRCRGRMVQCAAGFICTITGPQRVCLTNGTKQTTTDL